MRKVIGRVSVILIIAFVGVVAISSFTTQMTANAATVIEKDSGGHFFAKAKRKLQDRLDDACWAAYVACAGLCELETETGRQDAEGHNACMQECRNKWNDCRFD